MPAHASHPLLLLGVSYFSSLKHLYDREIQKPYRQEIKFIEIDEILYVDLKIHLAVLTEKENQKKIPGQRTYNFKFTTHLILSYRFQTPFL